ncbi:SRPBCC family protein [Streptomyces sp. P38-E01]|uniref:SRPBCC family protein n=1 Tax=Streptomyces tardus TaxID=2780544 RepID=A0A949JCG3_9ACTN|nr:SRPBCC family protein [Streptomyces tardus]MBU7596473.1 SRPBCC family protein [Streptomyces tardus]
MTATLHSEGDQQTLRFERVYRRPAADVWQTVTDPELMAAWFPARVDCPEPVAGAPMTFTFEGDDGPPSTGTVDEVVEPSVFAFTWDGDRIRLELTEEGEEKTQLVLIASFEGRDWAVRNAAGWHICLDLLKSTLADEPPKSSVGKRQSQLLKEYETLFRDS